jgi:hypothetical protein
MRTGLVLALVLAGFIATPASAKIWIATFTGTVSGGFDTTGEFGLPGAPVTGKNFTVTIQYDPMLGSGYSFATPPLYVTEGETRLGGSYYGAEANPLLSVILTIDGLSHEFANSYQGLVGVENTHFYDQSIHGGINFQTRESYENFLTIDMTTLDAPINLNTPFSGGPSQYPGIPGLSIGTGQITSHDPGHYRFAQINFAVTHATLRSAAPEPGAWMLLLCGFGAVGAALRERRRPALRTSRGMSVTPAPAG